MRPETRCRMAEPPQIGSHVAEYNQCAARPLCAYVYPLAMAPDLALALAVAPTRVNRLSLQWKLTDLENF